MTPFGNQTVFQHFGIDPVINACGIYTDLGGSMLSEAIWEAMHQANQYFISMPELLDKTGERIASLMNAPAARVTPGASAAIALGVGACMTGMDGKKWEQLPDTRGLRSEVLIFRSQQPEYKYASCATMPGAKLVPIGGPDEVEPGVIAECVTDKTACLIIPQHLTDYYDTPPRKLTAICDAAHRAGIPVVVDAAYLNYPLDLFKSFTDAGADLVCFSAKYFYGPNAGGFVVGTEELVRTVAGLDFTGFESGRYRIFGRPFKMGRYEVIAVTLALEHWMHQDHDVRWAEYAKRVATLKAGMPSHDGITARSALFTMDERLEDNPVNCLVLEFASNGAWTPAKLAERLRHDSPRIEAIVMDHALVFAVDAMTDQHAETLADRLRRILV